MNSSDQQTRERDWIDGKLREPSKSCKNSLARGAREHHCLQPFL